jgi:hypothetical protein
VNQAFFVPEWIRALSAPQSPVEWVEMIDWHYGQGGPAVFFGDIAFYSGDWDARERVARIDTNRCPLFMLTGEYDYSCGEYDYSCTVRLRPRPRRRFLVCGSRR